MEAEADIGGGSGGRAKHLKKNEEDIQEGGNKMAELAEVLQLGLKSIIDTLSKQRRLLQELVELETDKMDLMQYNQWVLEDKEDKKEDEMEEVEVEVE